MNRVGQYAISIVDRAAANLLFFLLRTLQWKRKTIHANLTLKYSKNIDLIYKHTIQNIAKDFCDILFKFNTYKNISNNINKYPCTYNNIRFEISSDSKDVLQKMRNGGIFLTAHYGNYESMGPWLCRLGIPLKASYIPLKPAWLNRIVETRIRAVDGKSYALSANTPREFLRLLDAGNLFCLLMDQDSRIPSAETGTFLGQKVHVNPLPGFLLKHRPETPVFICWIEEPEGANGKRKVLHAIEVTQKNRESSSVGEAFNRWLEERIEKDPTLWYGWTHRRFYSCNPEMYNYGSRTERTSAR